MSKLCDGWLISDFVNGKTRVLHSVFSTPDISVPGTALDALHAILRKEVRCSLEEVRDRSRDGPRCHAKSQTPENYEA